MAQMEIGSMTLSESMTLFRKKAGLSLVELAAIADVSKNTLSLIELGKTRPSTSTLSAFAKALNLRCFVTFENEARRITSPLDYGDDSSTVVG